jgi:tetratricopeptide (TPR) repeat protein
MIGLLLAAGSLSAANADDLAECRQRADRDAQFRACGAIIDRQTVDPKDRAVAHIERGLVYRAKRDIDKAIDDFDRAIELDPGSELGYRVRGAAYFAQNKSDSAIGDYTKAIELKPGSASTYDLRAQAYYRKGDADRAIADLDEAILLAPSNGRAHGMRGRIYREKGELDKAIADFDAAIRMSPYDAGPYIDRGLAFEFKGDREKAVADYRKGLVLSPGERVASQRLKKIEDSSKIDDQRECAKFETPDRAMAACNRLIESGTLSKDRLAFVYGARAAVHQRKGGLDQAIADHDQAIRLLTEARPTSWELAFFHFSRGDLYRSRGEVDQAIEDYNHAIRIAPKWDKPYSQRGAIYFNKGDFERALADISQVISFRPDSERIAYAYDARALVYLKMGQAASGLADADRAIELQSNAAGYYVTRAHLYEAVGRKQEAIADLRQARMLSPARTDIDDELKRLGVEP